METFSALLAICVGNSPVTGEFPAQRPVRRSFDVFFDLRLNKRLSKQWRGWWFETPSHPVWRHCNVIAVAQSSKKDFPEKGISATYEKYPSRNSTSWIHNHLTYSRKKKFQLAVWEKKLEIQSQDVTRCTDDLYWVFYNTIAPKQCDYSPIPHIPQEPQYNHQVTQYSGCTGA